MIRSGVLITTALLVMTSIGANFILPFQQGNVAFGTRAGGEVVSERLGGTIAASGNNIYTAWWNNKTGDFEVMFRASTDNGHTFGPKINLSSSPGVASTNAQITAEGNNVYVIWWETGANHIGEPFLRISYDNGKTFGEKIMLSNATASVG